MSIYNYEFKDNAGNTISMSDYKNKNVLIVNTASRCGFTKQYEALEKLNQKNFSDFEIIAFPCNQFGQQEPGTDAEIAEFCSSNYGVTFKIASKVDVNGYDAHPIYKYLKSAAKNNMDIGWNFEKFFVDKNGNVTNYNPDFDPMNFVEILDGSK